MSYDEAVAALNAAAEQDAADDGQPLTMPAESKSEPVTPEGSATPAATETAADAPVVEDSFSRADLNSLLEGVEDPKAREAIESAYKSFQGDYTRKTQELADQRKQFEEFGSPEAIKEALDFRTAMADPSNWQQIHTELTQAMQQFGMTPAEAAAEATRQMEEVTPPATPSSPELADLSRLTEDPDLAPLAQELQALRSELSTFKSQAQQEREALEQERYRDMLIGELTRQESVIRQANPTYTDADMQSIYELADHFGGNLLHAQQSYEATFRTRLERYLAQKAAVAEEAGHQVVPGAGVTTDDVVSPTEMSDREVDKLAEAFLEANAVEFGA